jgi:predicted nucleic acid-binding protein
LVDVLYLDANVFVYAVLNRESIGERARYLLSRIQEGKKAGSSSALTFDELVWAVRRHRSPEDAISAGEAFLGMPGLKLLEVNGDVLSSALDLIRAYKLDPRDSIHAASALAESAEALISNDEHFDLVSGLRRKAI